MDVLRMFDGTKSKEEVSIIEEMLTDVDTGYSLIVHNDEVNTFDWVIECLMSVCGHTEQQAEQCALFIHFKGKYAVKHGTETELIPLKEALLDRHLTATIEG
jgi:ATP-dependent Clp protease adaptor protein ClpS